MKNKKEKNCVINQSNLLYISALSSALLLSTPSCAMQEINDQEVKHNSLRINNRVVDKRSVQDEIEELRTSLAQVKKFIEENQMSELSERIIILGRAGSGKSTFIYSLAGILLRTMENDNGELCLQPTTILPNIEICHTSRAGTKLPCSWDSPEGSVYWDCPGFGDPRGPIKDIVNAYAIHHLFAPPSTVKVIVAVEENYLKGKANDFKNLLNQLTEVFLENDQLYKNLSLLITKHERLKINITLRNLYNEIEEETILNTRAIRLLDFFVKNPGRISSVPYPKPQGEYILDSEQQRLQAHISTTPIQNMSVNIGLDDHSKLLIDTLANGLNQAITDYIKFTGCQQMKKFTNRLIKNYGGRAENLREEFGTLFRNLDELHITVPSNPELFADSLQNILDVSIIRKNIEDIHFLKKIKSNVDFNTSDWLKALSTTIIDPFYELGTALEDKLDGETLQLTGALIGTSDIQLKINNSLKPITKINVNGKNTLFIDEDIMNNGLNLSLEAPRWKILNKKLIDISGKDGLDLEHAADGSSPGESGENGKLGNNGGNGGNFIGRGNKFINLENLTINTSGGSGGKGQDGGNGADGSNGIDANPTLVDSRDSTALRLSIPFRQTNGVRNLPEVILKGFLTLNDKLLQTYEATGTAGMKGGDAGRGGDGGKGGCAGIANIQNENGKFYHVNKDGGNGQPGEPGIPGKGGINGRTYYGIYVGEYILPQFRHSLLLNGSINVSSNKRGEGSEGGIGYFALNSNALFWGFTSKLIFKTGMKVVGKITTGTTAITLPLSFISAYYSSGWKERAYVDLGRAPDGKMKEKKDKEEKETVSSSTLDFPYLKVNELHQSPVEMPLPASEPAISLKKDNLLSLPGTEDGIWYNSSQLNLFKQEERSLAIIEQQEIENENFNGTSLEITGAIIDSLPQIGEIANYDYKNLEIPQLASVDKLLIRNKPLNTVGSSQKIYLIDDKEFRLQNVAGTSMRCFFNAVGFEAGAQIEKLRERSSDLLVRHMIANEIVSAVANPEQLPTQVRNAIQYTLYKNKQSVVDILKLERNEHLAAQSPDENQQSIQSLPELLQSLGQQEEKILQELRERSLSLNAFNAFIDYHIGEKNMMVALYDVQGEEGNNTFANYTSIDAIAYINNLGIKIYQPTKEDNLHLVHTFIPKNASEIAYLYHEPTHFQALIPK